MTAWLAATGDSGPGGMPFQLAPVPGPTRTLPLMAPSDATTGPDEEDDRPQLIGLRKWRTADWVPAAVDRAREQQFLDQYVDEAWRAHEVTATALVARAAGAADDDRHLLFLRLFAEYVNALEVLGGWGWAIRHRGEFKLLLDAFLAYAPDEVQSFYETVAAEPGDLAVLLGLCPLSEIASAWVERSEDESVREEVLLDEFERCAANLRQAAAQYFDRDQLIVTNYNKAKHGAPIIRTPALSPDEFFLLAPQRDPSESARYLFSRFRADDEMFARVAGNVTFVSRTTGAVVSLIRNLRTLELL
jgi:hypothetical protein